MIFLTQQTFPTISQMLENLEPYFSSPDRIVRDLFKNREDAIAFFMAYLPEALTGILDIEKLSYLPENYIDPKFREHKTDILFEIPTIQGNLTQVALLFEHKSTPDKSDFTQLLRYLSNIYEKQIKKIPVIPFLFYHTGSDILRESFLDLFELTEQEKGIFRKYIPDFTPETFFLSESDLAKVNFSIHLFAFLSTIRYADGNHIAEHWEELLAATAEVFRGEKGLAELMKLVLYILNRTDTPMETVKAPVLKISSVMEEYMVTTAERIRAAGKQEGMQQGMQQGEFHARLATAKNMLAEQVDLTFVLRVTGLSEQQLREHNIIP